MSALRSLLFLLFQLAVTPFYAAAMLLMAWSPRITTYRMAASWCAVNLWAAKVICGIRWRVHGRENIPTGEALSPHIVLSKHSSTWETLSLTQYFPSLAYVAKKELLSIPFFGWGFATASPITIDRKAGMDAMQQIAQQGRERFKQGFWIVIYPEGTRIRSDCGAMRWVPCESCWSEAFRWNCAGSSRLPRSNFLRPANRCPRRARSRWR